MYKGIESRSTDFPHVNNPTHILKKILFLREMWHGTFEGCGSTPVISAAKRESWLFCQHYNIKQDRNHRVYHEHTSTNDQECLGNTKPRESPLTSKQALTICMRPVFLPRGVLLTKKLNVRHEAKHLKCCVFVCVCKNWILSPGCNETSPTTCTSVPIHIPTQL